LGPRGSLEGKFSWNAERKYAMKNPARGYASGGEVEWP